MTLSSHLAPTMSATIHTSVTRTTAAKNDSTRRRRSSVGRVSGAAVCAVVMLVEAEVMGVPGRFIGHALERTDHTKIAGLHVWAVGRLAPARGKDWTATNSMPA